MKKRRKHGLDFLAVKRSPARHCQEPTTEDGRLEAAIFDMDGVLIDSHPAHRQAWKSFLSSMGREVDDAELDFILDGRKRGDILRYFLGELSDPELQEYGRRKDDFFQQIATATKPIPGVLRFLGKLRRKGVVTAVATSAAGSRARSTLARLQILKLFGAVVTGDDVSAGKPNPAVYQITCSRLKVAPQNAIAIEDAVSGVLAAKRAGLRCVAISAHQSSRKLKEAGADYVISDFRAASIKNLEPLLRWRRDSSV